MLLAELEDISTRPRIARLVPFGVAKKLFADVRGAARREPDPDVLPISRDPRDDYLVALASAVGADHLVTGDADLLDIVEPPVTITTLRTFADILDL
jgi:predicted nucleic acid-binding protein